MLSAHVSGRAFFNARLKGGFVQGVGVMGVMCALVLGTDPPAAVPAFAVQTGQPCKTCHIGAFGPQLTPFGRNFKLNGYTLRAGDSFTVPVSAMAVASYVHTQKDQPEPPADHFGTNDNTALDEASIFLAGRS